MEEDIIKQKLNTVGLQNLLNHVSIIQKKYDEIAYITGEKFNIFSVLNLTSNEVRTHSAFIGELLNIKGSHGLKEIPLKFFLKMLEQKFIINQARQYSYEIDLHRFKIDLETSRTIIEKPIGKLSEDKTDGGRIDIIVEDVFKKTIIIENKIYAAEQENQLIRYNNFSKNAAILFLTLNESKPKSAVGLIENKDYFNISYKNDIVNWLGDCLKEATDKPMLREVLKQYIYLIKKLTGQTLSKVMSNEIQETIIKNFIVAEQIVKDFENAKNKVRKIIRDGVIKKLETEIGTVFDIDIHKKDVGDKNSGIWLKLKNSKTKNIILGCEPFSGNGNERNRLFYGILDLDGKNRDIFIKNGFSNDEKGWWIERKRFETPENQNVDLNNIQFLEILGKSEKKQDKLVDDIASQMIKYVNDNYEKIIKICTEIPVEQ